MSSSDTTCLYDSTQRLRLVLVVDSLAGGGAEKVVLELARALIQLGHDAIVISLLDQRTYQTPQDIPVYFLYPLNRMPLHSRRKRGKHAADLKELVGHVESSRGPVDQVISNLDYSHYLVSACQFEHAVYVVHNAVEETLRRALRMGPVKWWRQRRLFRALHGQPLIAVSQGLTRELKTLTLFQPHSVHCIYNPFDFAHIRALANQPCEGIPSGNYLIHVGRYARQKRHDVLFAALKRLPAKTRLVCLGANQKGIRKLASKMGVADQVITPGFQQNPYPWIQQAACLVLSSDFEGFGNVLVEALCCDTPVVATDCPFGPNEILTGTLTQGLARRGDSEDVALKIQAVLQGQAPLAARDALQQFDHINVARAYLSYIMQRTSFNQGSKHG